MSISLAKGQTIRLEKTSGGGLTRVFMGLGWDAKQSSAKTGLFSFLRSSAPASIDLDASCLMFAGERLVDTVSFSQLQSNDGSIRHSGDNLTGDGDNDDEVIHVDLTRVPANVTTLLFTVNSFRGQTFNEVESARCRLVDATNQTEMSNFRLSGSGSHTGVFIAKLARDGGGWKMQALGDPATGRTADDMAGQAGRFL
jgi:tellurium resistance protein TerZ